MIDLDWQWAGGRSCFVLFFPDQPQLFFVGYASIPPLGIGNSGKFLQSAATQERSANSSSTNDKQQEYALFRCTWFPHHLTSTPPFGNCNVKKMTITAMTVPTKQNPSSAHHQNKRKQRKNHSPLSKALLNT
jgi:hypothetical protein